MVKLICLHSRFGFYLVVHLSQFCEMIINMTAYILLIAATLLFKFFQENTYLLIEDISSSLSCSKKEAADGFVCQAFGYMVSSVVVGVCGDLLGSRKVLLFSLVTTSVAALSIGAVDLSIPSTNFIRLILGLGMGGVNSCSYSQIKAITPKAKLPSVVRAAYFALFVSAAVYPLCTKVLMSFFHSWRMIMCLGAVVGLVLLVALSVTLPSENSSGFGIYDYPSMVNKVFCQLPFARCCMLAFMTVGYTYGLQALTSVYKQEVHFDQAILQSVGRCFMSLAVIMSGELFGQLSLGRYAQRGMLVLVCGLMNLLVSVFWGVQPLFFLGFVICYIAIGISQTAMKTEILALSKRIPGVAQGTMSLFGGFSEMCFGLVVYRLPWPKSFVVFVTLSLIIISAIITLLFIEEARNKANVAKKSLPVSDK